MTGSARGRISLIVVALLVLVAALVVIVRWSGSTQEDAHPTPAPLLSPVVAGTRVMHIAEAVPGFHEEEIDVRNCIISYVGQEVGLVEDLGDAPASSPRFAELIGAAERCRSVHSSVGALRTAFARREVAVPDDGRLRCLASGLATIDVAQRDEALRAGLSGLPAGVLRDRIREHLALCSIDTSLMDRS